jgi:hypothetical protein
VASLRCEYAVTTMNRSAISTRRKHMGAEIPYRLVAS